MEGCDPKGLDISFRRHSFELILNKLNDLATKSNYLTTHGSLNDLALKFEEKMYEKASNKQDYLCKIQNKLSEVARVYLPATFPAGNQHEHTVISSPVVQSYPTQQNFDGNLLLEQNLNMFSSQNQTNSNQLQQNQHFGQQAPQLGQQNLQFEQQNPQLGQQNLQFEQQNQHLIGYQNQQFGQQNVVQRDARYPLGQQNSAMNIERYKQSLESFNQVGNGQIHQTTYQASASQHPSPIADLQGQINQYRTSTSQHSSPVGNLQGQINQFRTSTSQHASPLANIQGQINQFRASASQPSSPLANLQAQINQFRDSTMQHPTPLTNLQGQINQFRASTSQHATPLANLQSQTNQFQASTAQLSSRLSNLQGQINQFQGSKAQSSSPLANLQGQINQFRDSTTQNSTPFSNIQGSCPLPNLQGQISQFQASTSQHLSPLANNLQGQINQFQDSRLHGSEMSSANFQSQNFVGDNLISQSHMPALSSFSDETTNADQCQLLIVQFRRAKLSYLPELQKWLKMFQGQLLQAQTINQLDGPKKHIIIIQQMIRLLNLPENELLLHGRDKLRQNLNGIISYYNQMVKKLTTSAVNQLSSALRPAYTNGPLNFRSGPTLMNRPVISSSTMAPGFSYPQAAPDNNNNNNTLLNIRKDPQIIHSPRTAPSLETLQSKNLVEMGNQLMNSTANQATSSTSKLPEKRKEPMDDSTTKPSTNAIIRASKKPRLEPKGQPSTTSHESWFDLANIRSKNRYIPSRLHKSSEPNGQSCPSTPTTPCSIPKENEDLVKSSGFESFERNNGDCQDSVEASKAQGEPMLDQGTTLPEIPELSVSSLVSGCSGIETNQPQPSNQPIDRLMNAVNSISKEALISGVNDMRSAIIEMDRLPEIAYSDDSEPSVDDDLTIFLEDLHYYCTDNEEPPNKKIKRELESVSRGSHDSPQWSELEPSQDLQDEIKETNHRLFETSIQEVETGSSNESNGTIVRCTYSPIAMSSETKRMFACDSINLSVEFLVPSDYPISSPKILDCRLPARSFGVSIEMTERAKSILDSQVRCVDPLRLAEMAQVWDLCARSVLQSYAKFLGAETFSSKYGAWERIAY